ncbi:MAG TPA: hypothetical protein VG097_14670, partial [Gemmata sp.]|nr:hypothetical protein [Gemmata sp.]
AYELPTKERPTNLMLSQVKSFGTLITDAQNQGKPIWEVSGGNAMAKSEARQLFSELATNVITQTE